MKSFPFILLLMFTFTVSATTVHFDADGNNKWIPKGSSKEIIFIHGMFVTPESWGPFLNYFSNDYTVSAPAWPHHDLPAATLQKRPAPELAQLTLKNILDHYRKILLPKKGNPPILIGHSMGGLIAQILLSEGLASAAVAIDSAPPKGVFVLSYSFLKANWPSLNPFADINEPIHLTLEEFSYAFTNQQTSLGQIQAYENFYVPESRRVGRAPLTDEARINRFQARGPLLLVAGGEDHIIPARLNYANFEFYKEARTENYTEFIMLEGKDHWGMAGRRWEEVARSIKVWLADIEYKEWLTNLK